MDKETYLELLKRPEWISKKKEILAKRGHWCEECGADPKQIHLHHTYYFSKRYPWEYPDDCLLLLCKKCHSNNHEEYSDKSNMWEHDAAFLFKYNREFGFFPTFEFQLNNASNELKIHPITLLNTILNAFYFGYFDNKKIQEIQDFIKIHPQPTYYEEGGE